jgi:hypothetical protein
VARRRLPKKETEDRVWVPLLTLYVWAFLGQLCAGWGNVPAEARSSSPSAAALSFAADFLIVAVTLNGPFADEASLAVKGRMAAASAKGFALVADRLR